ncbi:hypothetical protein K469DRAFT_703008 [Zopfia rhizophila CBS 207.26]|uniref:Uncharacterized protein n=1 Tax=Zopfia rhizophila CBS 207.26 TaxID=1314779 RepID=A0A6A6DAA2_9PEZI|nr:hypothetical protein K469DRAFT_703008 [Zopfia rhizophila CBS 207.26]
MSDVTRHIERKHKQQVPFLQLCHTCQEYFLDPQEFEEFHGKNGEKCHNPRLSPRGEAQSAQWQALCRKLHPSATSYPSLWNGNRD